jgi:hypothetical protein
LSAPAFALVGARTLSHHFDERSLSVLYFPSQAPNASLALSARKPNSFYYFIILLPGIYGLG